MYAVRTMPACAPKTGRISRTILPVIAVFLCIHFRAAILTPACAAESGSPPARIETAQLTDAVGITVKNDSPVTILPVGQIRIVVYSRYGHFGVAQVTPVGGRGVQICAARADISADAPLPGA